MEQVGTLVKEYLNPKTIFFKLIIIVSGCIVVLLTDPAQNLDSLVQTVENLHFIFKMWYGVPSTASNLVTTFEFTLHYIEGE